MRSQSGSVATTTSAFSFSASPTASERASAFSGFGDFTVGKRGSKATCDCTSLTSQPAWMSNGTDMTPPVPWMFVNTTWSLVFLKTLGSIAAFEAAAR